MVQFRQKKYLLSTNDVLGNFQQSQCSGHHGVKKNYDSKEEEEKEKMRQHASCLPTK